MLSLLTFGILRLGDAVQRWLRHPEPSSSSLKSTIREKLLYVKDNTSSTAIAVPLLPLSRRRRPRLLRKAVNSPLEKALYPLFLLPSPPQKKKLSKRKRRYEISRSAERDKGSAFTPSRRRRHTCFAYVSIPLNAPPFEKGGRKLIVGVQKLIEDKSFNFGAKFHNIV